MARWYSCRIGREPARRTAARGGTARRRRMTNRAGAARVSRTSDGRTGRRRLLCAAGIAALAAAGRRRERRTRRRSTISGRLPTPCCRTPTRATGSTGAAHSTPRATARSTRSPPRTPASCGSSGAGRWRRGSQQTTPLAYGGVLYIANPGERVQAIDGANGELLWGVPAGAPAAEDGSRPANRQHRNLAIYQDKIYLNTSDAHIVALGRPHRRGGVGQRHRGRGSATATPAGRSSPTARCSRG